MKIDYKFWYIKRDDPGYISEATIRFFFGNITTETENGQPITRYRRTGRIPVDKLERLGIQVIFDANGNPAVLLTPNEFGQIKSDEELRAYCNSQLARIPGYQPINEQT